MSEYEKMVNGEAYNALDKELSDARIRARFILKEYNNSAPDDPDQRAEILYRLFGKKYKNITIEPPLFCDYGINIELGENVYMNTGCTILDCARVKIGSNTFIGPNTQIYTPIHPLQADLRRKWLEYAKPVVIGDDCWLGGNVTIVPGVTIGNNCVIGAGAVVTKNIPDNSLAVGNPARVIRKLEV